MCARYTIESPPQMLRKILLASKPDEIMEMALAKSVIFPGYTAPICYVEDGKRQLWAKRWGLLVRGAKEAKSKYATHNATVERLIESRLYSPPWKEGRRCVIPMRYFVEWTGEKGSKTPLAIRDPSAEIMFAAGIWDRTEEFAPVSFDSFTMFTCEPNDFMSKIHDRMPVLLRREQVDEWLDPKVKPEQALKMLKPWSGQLEAKEISKKS